MDESELRRERDEMRDEMRRGRARSKSTREEFSTRESFFVSVCKDVPQECGLNSSVKTGEAFFAHNPRAGGRTMEGTSRNFADFLACLHHQNKQGSSIESK